MNIEGGNFEQNFKNPHAKTGILKNPGMDWTEKVWAEQQRETWEKFKNDTAQYEEWCEERGITDKTSEEEKFTSWREYVRPMTDEQYDELIARLN